MITIEQIDKVMSLTGKSYKEVREALIMADGDVVRASDILLGIRTDEGKEQVKDTGAETKNEDRYSHEEVKFTAEEAPKEEKSSGRSGSPDIVESIIREIRTVWEKGNASSLLVEKNGETVIKLSLTVGTIGFVLATIPSIIGIGAAILSDYKIKIIMDDGQVIDVTGKIMK